MKIFVSYSRRDAGDFAKQINRHLSTSKNDIFTDVDDIKAGEVWSSIIEENISSCDIFVVIVTHGALDSPYVEREVFQAQREKKKIIPCFHISVIESEIKWGLDKIQGVEFTNEFQLARDLHSKIVEHHNPRSKKEDEIVGSYSNSVKEKERYSKKDFKKKIVTTLKIVIAIIMMVVGLIYLLSGMLGGYPIETFLAGVILIVISSLILGLTYFRNRSVR